MELHGGDIAKRNLYRNFCLHLTNLYDFGLLSVEDVRGVIELYHSQRKAAAAQPMEVSCDDGGGDEDVKIVYCKPESSGTATATIASNERSPLKRLSSNLEDSGSDWSPPAKVPSSSLCPPSQSKYKKKLKREKFPSYD